MIPGVNIRAMQPKPVTNAKQALEAFRRMNQYRQLSRKAGVRAGCYSVGTMSWEIHQTRANHYEDIADMWEEELGKWLEQAVEAQAGSERP